jgi:cyanophycinase
VAGELALVGGGEWTDGCTFDRGLVEASGADEVVVLPTGSAYENPGRVVARADAWFDRLGVRSRPLDVLTRADALVEEHVGAVRAARFVYLVGTSPMHLRSVLKDSPLLDALVAAWRDGAVLAGSGAGADVLCDPMVDTRGGAFTVGLGLVPGLAVIPRANQWSPEKVHRTVELAPPDLPVAVLPEATALVRSGDGRWRTEGVGEVVVHRGGAVVGLDALPSD